MRRLRFYQPELPKSGEFLLSPDEAQHVARTLRLKPGAELEVFDGAGRAILGQLLECHRKRVRVGILEELPTKPTLSAQLTVAAAPPKGRRAGFLIEKLCELGVHDFQPLITEHSSWSAQAVSKERGAWQRKTVEAAKQCHRDELMKVHEACTAEQLKAGQVSVFGALSGRSARSCLASLELAQAAGPLKIVIAIGPEGGWSKEEEQEFQNKGFQSLQLGYTVLRIETAALALTSLFAMQLSQDL